MVNGSRNRIDRNRNRSRTRRERKRPEACVAVAGGSRNRSRNRSPSPCPCPCPNPCPNPCPCPCPNPNPSPNPSPAPARQSIGNGDRHLSGRKASQSPTRVRFLPPSDSDSSLCVLCDLGGESYFVFSLLTISLPLWFNLLGRGNPHKPPPPPMVDFPVCVAFGVFIPGMVGLGANRR